MKAGHVAPSTAENESGPGAKNMKTGTDDLGTVENGTRRPQYS
jgi:hypothetical protein